MKGLKWEIFLLRDAFQRQLYKIKVCRSTYHVYNKIVVVIINTLTKRVKLDSYEKLKKKLHQFNFNKTLNEKK